MKLTSQAIENDRILLFLLLAVMIAGIAAFVTSPRNEDPGFTVRQAVVYTAFPGGSPERVEQLITDKLEKSIQEMPEVNFTESESSTGQSIIYVNLHQRYSNVRPIWDTLRRKVNKTRADLPEAIFGPIVNDEFGEVFGVVFGLTGDGYSYAELEDVANQVRDEFVLLEDVAKVQILGIQDERIFLEFNDASASRFGFSGGQLQEIIKSTNIIISGGDVVVSGERIVLEPTGNIQSVEDLEQIVVQIPGLSGMVYLGDLFDIYRGYVDPPTSVVMHVNGTPGLGLAISMREGGNILDMGSQIETAVEQLTSLLPIGIELEPLSYLPKSVELKIEDFMSNLLQAVAIVGLVMLIALGLRTGLVVVSLVPMAIVMTFMFMGFFDIGIDQVSLAALIIALGLLVDNGIVISESILVQINSGTRAIEAAIATTKELGVSLLVASMTTIAAFLPIYLAESDTGEFCAPLFYVVSICLLSSWILSVAVIPYLCVRFLKPSQQGDDQKFDTRFYHIYRNVLITVVRRPVLSIVVLIAVFAGSQIASTQIPQVFFPPGDKPAFTAKMALPMGTDIETTRSMLSQVEDFVQENLVAGPGRPEGITNFAGFVGQSPPRIVLPFNPEPFSSEIAYLMAQTTSNSFVVNELEGRIESFAAEHFPDARVTVDPLPLAPKAKAPVEFRILGPDADVVFDKVRMIKEKFAATSGLINVRDNWGPRTKKMKVVVDAPQARRAGLTNQDIAVSLQTVLKGFEVTKYREGNKVIPVTLRAKSLIADDNAMSALLGHNVASLRTGQRAPLRQVADLEVVWEPSKIFRRGGLPTVSVQADVQTGFNPMSITAELDEWLVNVSESWPLGYRYEVGGETESAAKANDSVMEKSHFAGIIICILLVAQFNSFRKALIVLLTIMLGLIGVIWGLLGTGAVFGFMTLLGILSLAGIVINNAIVLLDKIKVGIDELGLEPARAIIEAAQQRLRPILVTTATTVLGLLPLWYGGGPMWEPMAIAIIFGLLFATVLTLGVVPLLYSAFFRVSFADFKY